MYTMKQACAMTNMSYETLKYYCNQGLVPNVKRDEGNRRVFDDRDIACIHILICLKHCNLSIEEMKDYIGLCRQGPESIPQRQRLLAEKQQVLLQRQQELQSALDYIQRKQNFYGEVLAGRAPYHSIFMPEDKD